jgi:hypothetical protein
VSIQIGDLTLLQLNLLIKIDFLLSDDVQFLDLLIDSSLSLSQSSVDLLQLFLDLLDLVLSILDHLIRVLDLSLEMIGKLSLLSLLKVLLQ